MGSDCKLRLLAGHPSIPNSCKYQKQAKPCKRLRNSPGCGCKTSGIHPLEGERVEGRQSCRLRELKPWLLIEAIQSSKEGEADLHASLPIAFGQTQTKWPWDKNRVTPWIPIWNQGLKPVPWIHFGPYPNSVCVCGPNPKSEVQGRMFSCPPNLSPGELYLMPLQLKMESSCSPCQFLVPKDSLQHRKMTGSQRSE